MGHGPEEHMEHAEHAQHAAHNPFDRAVTVSIAIVAAVLAAVSVGGHKAHTETLRLQGEVLKYQTLIGISRTDMADQYAFYQAKNNRKVMYEAFLDFLSVLPLKEGSEKANDKITKRWKDANEKYKKELPEMLVEAKKFAEKSKDYEKEAASLRIESHREHVRADRYDLADIGLQLGVVLCSLAILTKSRSFWGLGVLCALAGAVVALSGYLEWFPEHHEEHKAPEAPHHSRLYVPYERTANWRKNFSAEGNIGMAPNFLSGKIPSDADCSSSTA